MVAAKGTGLWLLFRDLPYPHGEEETEKINLFDQTFAAAFVFGISIQSFLYGIGFLLNRLAGFTPHSDKEFMALRTELAAAYADFFAISDKVDEGVSVKVETVNKMSKRLRTAAEKMHAYLDKHKAQIDNPYVN